MEPEFDTALRIPQDKLWEDCSNVDKTDSHSINVPSLVGRFQPGQTFGDFHQATISAFTTQIT
jgi:hypothetical protein